MAIEGNVFEIVQLLPFFAAHVQHAPPPPGSVAPLAGARVVLIGRPGPPHPPKLEAILGEQETDATGAFAFPSPLARFDAVRLLVQRDAPDGRRETLHRCAPAATTLIDDRPLELFTAAVDVGKRITQADVDSRLQEPKADLGLDTLTARIEPGGLQVHGARGGVTVDLFVRLHIDVSARLDRLVDPQIENLVTHVPFPASLCLSEQELERAVRAGVEHLFAGFNDDTLADLPLPSSDVAVSVRRLDFPVVVTGGIGRPVELAIDAKGAIGVPDALAAAVASASSGLAA